MLSQYLVRRIPRLGRFLSGDTLARKASLNAVSSTLDYSCRVLVGFLVTPLMVAGLGDVLYGLWVVLFRVSGYMSAAGGRPTQALKLTLANRQGSADVAEKRRSVGSALLVWALFLPLTGLLGLVVAWYAPALLRIPAEYLTVARWTIAVLVLRLALMTLGTVPRSMLEGENLGYQRMGLSAVLVLVGGGLTAVAVVLDTGLVGVAVAALVAVVLHGWLFTAVARASLPWCGVALPSRLEFRQFLGLTGWFLSWRLIVRLMLASDVVILNLFAAPEVVTLFTLTKFGPETLVEIVAVMVFAVSPGLGGLIGSGDLGRAARVRAEVMTFTWLILNTTGVTMLLWNGDFIRLWVGQPYYAGTWTTLLMLATVAQLVLIRNDGNFLDLTLKLRPKVLIGVGSAVLSVAFSIVAVGPLALGIPGLCLGMLAGRALSTVSYPVLIGRHLKLPVLAQLRSALRPLSISALLVGACLALRLGSATAGWLHVRSWPALVGAVGVSVILAALVSYHGGMSAEQRARARERLRGVLGRDKSGR